MDTDSLRVALVQMDIELGNWERNMAAAQRGLEMCFNLRAELAVLPEMWSIGFLHQDNFPLMASRLYSRTMDQLAGWARKYRLHLLAGSIPEPEGKRLYNTAFLFDPNGSVLGFYRKHHLFHLIQEDRWFTPGLEVRAIDTPWGRIGCLICFDLRFPLEFELLREQGARLVILPAQFPEPRLSHWQTLLKARALETQSYVLACNRMGRDSPSLVYFGHSLVASPGGEIILEGANLEGPVATQLDLSLVEKVRQEFPVYTGSAG